jgi:hypothetical protein
MKIFYSVVLIIYLAWFIWYGGSGQPLSPNEAAAYKAELQANAKSRGVDVSDPIKYMDRLIKDDDGNEFIMVNLIRFRDEAQYPPESPWANETDPMLADDRYGAGIVPLLLKRGSLPIFISTVAGEFINEAGQEEWDTVAMVRYRSVRDMVEMMIEMSATDLADHKWAAIEQTHVFPVKPKINLVSLRLIAGIILLLFAVAVSYLVKLGRSKN